jgi:hypothetical protein
LEGQLVATRGSRRRTNAGLGCGILPLPRHEEFAGVTERRVAGDSVAVIPGLVLVVASSLDRPARTIPALHQRALFSITSC